MVSTELISEHLLLTLREHPIDESIWKQVSMQKKEFELFLLQKNVPNAYLMQHARMHISNTIRRNAGLSAWEQANRLVGHWVNEDEPITWERILHVNGILRAIPSSAVRETEIYCGPYQCLPLSQLASMIEVFSEKVLCDLGERNTLVCATQIYQWLISMHPFADGNGRCARLITDWFLMREGLVPLCFSSPIASYMMVHEEKQPPFSMCSALLAQGIVNSFTLLMSPIKEDDLAYDPSLHRRNGSCVHP